MGENGAGKSTLIKCLAGVHKPDDGDILVEGQSVEFAGPSEARGAGIETVYQDSSSEPRTLMFLLIFFSVASSGMVGIVDSHSKSVRCTRRPTKMLKNFGIRLPFCKRAKLRNLSGGQRQGVSIARATGWGTRHYYHGRTNSGTRR